MKETEEMGKIYRRKEGVYCALSEVAQRKEVFSRVIVVFTAIWSFLYIMRNYYFNILKASISLLVLVLADDWYVFRCCILFVDRPEYNGMNTKVYSRLRTNTLKNQPV